MGKLNSITTLCVSCVLHIKSFDEAILSHGRVLADGFDSIKKVSKPNKKNGTSSSVRIAGLQFLFPFALAVFNILDSIYQYSTGNLSEMITHRILPREFWYHGDIIVLLGFVMAITIYGNLLMKPCLDEQYCISAIGADDHESSMTQLILNSKPLSAELTPKLLNFRQKFKRVIQIVFLVVWLEMDSLFVWQLLMSWGHSSLRDVFLLVHVPTFFLYGGYANIVLICYFILNAHYIRYVQKHYTAVLNKQTIQLEKCNNEVKGFDPTGYFALWYDFNATQQDVMDLLYLIHGQNRFWSRYLTTYFVIYIIQITYLAYAFFFIASSIDLFHRGFFIFFALNFLVILSLLTYECSRICDNNIAIHKQSGKFYRIFRAGHSLSTANLVRIDNCERNQKLFSRVTFTLLNNYEINSRMFELLFSYISTLFMMILRKNY